MPKRISNTNLRLIYGFLKVIMGKLKKNEFHFQLWKKEFSKIGKYNFGDASIEEKEPPHTDFSFVIVILFSVSFVFLVVRVAE